jgi:hypothetical protein
LCIILSHSVVPGIDLPGDSKFTILSFSFTIRSRHSPAISGHDRVLFAS